MRPRQSTPAAQGGICEPVRVRQNDTIEGLLRRCEQRMREFPLPTPFDIMAFAHTLGARRGRPITFLALPHLQPVMGFWIPGPTEDIVVYAHDTTKLHQEHVILHELCHIWCGHAPITLTSETLAALMKGDVTEVVVHHLWRRASYSSAEDREAEVMASLIVQRTAMEDWPTGESAQPADDMALQHFAAVLDSTRNRSP